MHRLLQRQIDKHLKGKNISLSEIEEFLNAVKSAYIDLNEAHLRLERILEISSNELFASNQKLNKLNSELEQKIKEGIADYERINVELRKEVEQKTKYLHELNEQRNLMASILNSMPMHIYLKDFDGRYIFVNDVYCRYHGLNQKELIEKRNTEIFSQEAAKIMIEHDNRVKQEKGTVIYEEKIDKGAQERYFLTYKTYIQGKTNNDSFLLGFSFDITERKLSEIEIAIAKSDAEKATAAKSQFLSNMSHEIRTPLNAIVGLIDLTEDYTVPAKVKEYLTSIKFAADNLLYIVNDILDFSKIEAGKIELVDSDFSLRRQITELVKAAKFRADEKLLKIHFEIDDAIPEYISSDPIRLNQILMNLLNNAVKFTREGEVKITCNLSFIKDNSYFIEFKVADTGIGIPESKLENIFESFTQVSEDTRIRYGGTGLGLAICKKLVEHFGGEITVTSEEGKGSEFKFVIPVKKGKSQLEMSTLEIKPSEITLKNLSILLVEDNKINQFVGKQILEKLQAKVDIAENGEIAIEKLKNNSFDLVLMDLQMPVMNGYKATQVIRENKHGELNSNIPIIALTADAFPETRINVLSHGMDDFIPKPVDKKTLIEKISRFAKSLELHQS